MTAAHEHRLHWAFDSPVRSGPRLRSYLTCRNGIMYVAMKSSNDGSTAPDGVEGITPQAVAENAYLARVSPQGDHETVGRDLKTARDR